MKTTKLQNFENQITEHIKYFYAFAFQLTANQHEAEDIVQETILTGLQKINQLNDINKMKAWLRKICFNYFLQRERKTKKVIILPDDEILNDYKDDSPTPEDEVIVDEVVREIRDGCFTSMATKFSHGQRSAFILIEIFGFSIEEAASLMEISNIALKALLHRARKNMNAFFGKHCQWVFSENHCKCKAWAEFVTQRDKLKQEVRKHGGPPDFNDSAYNKKSDPATVGRVLALFKQVPYKTPSDLWYKDISARIKKELFLI